MSRAAAASALGLVAVGLAASLAGWLPLPASGRADPGLVALEAYDCGVCHRIPGVRGARGTVGPPLAGFGRRIYVAGRFPNDEATLARWIVDPPALAPGTAMPAIGVSERDARDMAAYLHRLR
jgi:cytochrome c